jgi:3-methyladenine DNA glycosylase AlkD
MSSLTASQILTRLRRLGSAKNRLGMARFGIVSDKVFGVGTKPLFALKKQIGRNHALALTLWKTGWYEARALAFLIADPDQVTQAMMDRWAKDFDNWAITDGTCLHLFADTPHGTSMALKWVKRKEEFVKRAGFVILAVRAVHDKKADDREFVPYLKLIEKWSKDERNGVKKGVNWALRQIGKRSLALHPKALAVAEKLAASSDPTARWIGSDAARELRGPKVISRLRRQALKRNMEPP